MNLPARIAVRGGDAAAGAEDGCAAASSGRSDKQRIRNEHFVDTGVLE
jgi:hypothetical protein